ncbi:transglutaminase family protein [Candidatus Palauibacter sp.]|uniref:transglutaminase family protein n=1 Tax=Candidatus Palauibacter sp. TaxID=3101350 RepID=UPI003B5A4710
MITRYSVEHSIEFVYSAPVRASMMTLYLCPIQDRNQLVRGFSIETDPPGPVFDFDGCLNSRGHFFDRPGRHRRLSIRARSTVEVGPIPPTPTKLRADAWETLGRAARAAPELGLMLQPSRFVRPSPVLDDFMASCGLEPGKDPLASALALRTRLHELFDYLPGTTAVDSPIERILESREGVCQDYAHVMASILRGWGIPTRYVSGYLGPDGADSRDLATGESHAWVESWFPGPGWIGFDPTNDTQYDDRHVRVAVGRDYADVPPTRGVFRGAAESMLHTRVRIARQRSTA